VDEAKGIVSFGNGINGRRPPKGAALRVEYRVSAGARGNLPRGIQWTVAGVSGRVGGNSEVTAGRVDARDLPKPRAIARQQVRSARPIVTSVDLEDAALALKDLDVRRALELVPGASARRVNGARVLVAVGPHDAQPAFEESALWLGEIRRRLAPRLP